ncbi:MAG: glycosyltransferase family 2 protein [Proteobacteria bacterium]|nr:glycosyltransferase family 2 protein [Pseudomonadota bacterium]
MEEKISIVIPIFNEKLNIEPLYQEVIAAMSSFNFEIILVDDGSSDKSYEVYQKLAEKDERVIAIRFTTNCGKAAAYTAGFQLAEGDIVVTMDGDLQDDPTDIPILLEEINKGYEMVVGWKKTGKSSFIKFILSKIFNAPIRLFSSIKLKDMNCPLKAMKSEIAKNLVIYGNLHRYIPLLTGLKSSQVSQVAVKNRDRIHGSTKYGFNKYAHGFFDFITVYLIQRFTLRPMHLFGGLGIISFLIGFFIDGWLSFEYLFFDRVIDGATPTLLLGLLLIILGALFTSIGLLGEIQLKNTFALNKNLQYSVKKIYKKKDLANDHEG